LPLQLLLFDGSIGDIAAFEGEAERAVDVGDAVDGAVLFDPTGGPFPFDSALWVVGDGPEPVGEVGGRVVCNGVAAGAGVDAERNVEFSPAGGEPGVLDRPSPFDGQVGCALVDAAFERWKVAAGDHSLLVQLVDALVEVAAFAFVPEGGERGPPRGERCECSADRVALDVGVLELLPVDAVLGLEPLEPLVT
jgi:hypothetical protein